MNILLNKTEYAQPQQQQPLERKRPYFIFRMNDYKSMTPNRDDATRPSS